MEASVEAAGCQAGTPGGRAAFEADGGAAHAPAMHVTKGDPTATTSDEPEGAPFIRLLLGTWSRLSGSGIVAMQASR